MQRRERAVNARGRASATAALCLLFSCSSNDETGLGDASGAGSSASGAGRAGAPTAGAANSGGSGASAGRAGSGSGGSQQGGAGSASSGAGTTSGGSNGATGGAGTGSGGGGRGSGGRPGMSAGAGGATGGAGTGGAGTGGGAAGAAGDTAALCERWNGDRDDMGEGTWSGDLESCEPGDISEDGRSNALKLVNLYRFLAELPTVTTTEDRNQIAQACALVMDANNKLSHEPPEDWKCWSQDALEGASTGNISTGPGVSSVDLYMVDTGNEDTLGHRRWILSNSLGPIGLGSTGAMGSSCMQALTGEGKAGKPWQAWPPPGVFPTEAVKPGRFGDTLDDTGWSIQSDSIDLGDATVTVSAGGTDLPVTVNQLPAGYGSRYAISFQPDGWETTAGQTYAVSVAGTSTPIAYEVIAVDCAP